MYRNIKPILLFVFTVLCLSIDAQDGVRKPRKVFDFSPGMRLVGGKPFSFGNNFLNEANDAEITGGMSVRFLELYGFGFGGGFLVTHHKVSDAALGGNIPETNLRTVFFDLTYEQRIGKSFFLTPRLGIGEAQLHQKKKDKSYGRQKGTSYLAGLYLDYDIAQYFQLFAGVNYNYLSLNVETHPTNESFFNQGHQVLLMFGLKFDFRPYRNIPKEK